jgi:ribonuclease I
MKTFAFLVTLIFISSITLHNTFKTNSLNNSPQINAINYNCQDFEYDFYVLSLQYKPGMCIGNDFCNQLVESRDVKWTIHGLWPSKKDRSDISDCSNEKLNYENFDKNLKTNLNKYWPTLMEKGSIYSFHNHEWSKHGTCLLACKYGIKKTSSQFFYFQKTLELRDKYDPAKYLKPVDGSMTFTEIKNAFMSVLKVDVVLICKKIGTKEYLVEIRLVLDLDDFKPYSLNQNGFYKSRCNSKNNIYF